MLPHLTPVSLKSMSDKGLKEVGLLDIGDLLHFSDRNVSFCIPVFSLLVETFRLQLNQSHFFF